MKHTIKLLTLAFMLATILTLTGCPGPVNTVDVWNDGVVTTEPTCTAEGVKTYTCSNGETRTETIPALGHDFDEWEITKNSTCTEKGSKTRKCSRCDETETVEIDALGHDWVLESDTATCTTEGVKTYKCSRCNETRTEDSPALGHNFEGGYCERCGEYEFEYHFTVKVFTSREEFLNVALYHEESEDSTNVYYSFEEEPNISVNELLSLKSRFRGRNIIMAYDDDYYGDWGEDLPYGGGDCWSLDEKGIDISDLIVLISN